MSRIDEIRARLAAATPGPWRIGSWGACVVAGPDAVDVATAARQVPPGGGYFQGEYPDAALIAAAPDDLAYLLSEAERLEARAAEHDAEVRRAALEDAALAAEQEASYQRRDFGEGTPAEHSWRLLATWLRDRAGDDRSDDDVGSEP
jgi:hypothetical protein